MDALGRNCLETIASAMLILCVAVVPALAQTTVQVPGQANPYLAGMPTGSTCCRRRNRAGFRSGAVPHAGLHPAHGRHRADVQCEWQRQPQGSTPPADPPDGGDFIPMADGRPRAGTPSANGISGVNAPINSLVGVFLTDSPPNSSGPPPALDFHPATGLGLAFARVSPFLKQVFFIGDGLTGNGTGAVQQFIVPAGATRLFLGAVDGSAWHNNRRRFHGPGVGPGGPALPAPWRRRSCRRAAPCKSAGPPPCSPPSSMRARVRPSIAESAPRQRCRRRHSCTRRRTRKPMRSPERRIRRRPSGSPPSRSSWP